MKTQIVLSQTDDRPIYAQIMDEIKQRVALGDWEPGLRLPSIRELAAELRVSVITVKRAYLELERGGVIVTQQGRGSFVSENVAVSEVQQEKLNRLLQEVARLAATMGLSEDDLRALLSQALKRR
ncbi:MAG: GntR family transcriptional regulator [Pseudomonadota bacterium]